jgi:hypothetical protein
MTKKLAVILLVLLLIPVTGFAQKAGSFIAGMDIGMTSASGDFSGEPLNSSTGFGIGAELRYTLINNISFGPFIKYNRFGSDIQSGSNRYSYNFTQYGGLLRFNMVSVDSGKFYLLGGGGIFTPIKHTWATDFTTDEVFEQGNFFMGGIGICTNPYAATVFEIEFRYNTGEADLITDLETETHNFDFFYLAMKLSFNSKGFKPTPRY